MVFHVLNRGVGRRGIFQKDEDNAAFERVMAHALTAEPVRLLAYSLMPSRWRLPLWSPGRSCKQMLRERLCRKAFSLVLEIFADRRQVDPLRAAAKTFDDLLFEPAGQAEFAGVG